ncbi:Alkylated DNA repair protein alkB-like protein 8 [Heracleum sosnowskyi]|uniref:Alkylated DNA repair protein alkB-like protein 8 n=1 Tax=Heracleum sosnowskyi TaxID=360622 RepID=A0AAD8J776_9APIA|nr:Alkylated DNA repair protein alkB-like protein 8 [Heracleum sosnowskyi]
MSPASGIVSHLDQAPMLLPHDATSSSCSKDAVIAWFRGEFAAANAIIDVLCNHLSEVHGVGDVYESTFGAIHRRRLNWIPILQMQKYYPISDVVSEIKSVTEKKGNVVQKCSLHGDAEVIENGGDHDDQCYSNVDGFAKSEITNGGYQNVQPKFENLELYSINEDCEAHHAQIKVNVVRGLKLYQDMFTDIEISKLTNYVNELRVSGQNGELSGETFIMYHQQVNGRNKRELIQLGAPIFGPVKKEATSQCQKSQIEPIPETLLGVIDNLVCWHLVSEGKKPNSCIINFFDEGEYSQPFLKPPHLDQPISILLLSQSEMAFGRTLVCDSDGNYKGPLMLSLRKGSLLVMRGNSADMARHVMCPSLRKRISITFFRVQTDGNMKSSSPLNRSLTLWQEGIPNGYSVPNGTYNRYEAMDVISNCSVLRNPMVMSNPKRIPRGGTGVFLPWTIGSEKPAEHLPPRAERGRLFELPSLVETHNEGATSDANISTEGRSV